MENKKTKQLTVSILSLSLLTVMAGAAVAPALGVIKAHFAQTDQLFVQMIISIPALFIVLTSLVFPRLASRFGAKTLVLIGLALYTVGGCAAGAFDSIALVLLMRSLVGVGVGLIMPLSTGLLSFYFPPERQEGLMGISSAMNQLGGVVATLASGLLANVSWRLSFMVYLMGLISIVLCLIFMPNDRIRAGGSAEKKQRGSFARYSEFIISMFLLMTAFFIYPSNFAIITSAAGVIDEKYLSVIMAGMDLVAFFGGLLFVRVKRLTGAAAKFTAPLMFLCGYALLCVGDSALWVLPGSALIGFANGCGIPYIISTASKTAGRAAVTTVMPLLSAAMYLAQFVSPFIISILGSVFGSAGIKLPYFAALGVSALLILSSAFIKETSPGEA